MADKIKSSTPVHATTHDGNTRPNIPTAELEDFERHGVSTLGLEPR